MPLSISGMSDVVGSTLDLKAPAQTRAGPTTAPMSDELVVPIAPERVPFLIGIKGRNVALIGKHTGAFLKIGETSVQIVPRKSGTFNGDLAHRLVLAVCQVLPLYAFMLMLMQ